MTVLSVNLNKVALVRNARAGLAPPPSARPSVRAAAEACLRAGADGVTLHPRPDRRHALPEDVLALAALLRETAPRETASRETASRETAPRAGATVELNVEGNPFAGPEAGRDGGPGYPGFLALVGEARPHQATLVPDAADQLTSDHGWALGPAEADRLRPVIAGLRAQGARVSLFVDADAGAVERAAAVGADRVELYTGPYAEAFARGEADAVLPRYRAAAERAHALGLGLNAGHDLDLDNLGPFLRAVPGVAEVSIGQALVADALERGLEGAVAAYLAVIREAA